MLFAKRLLLSALICVLALACLGTPAPQRSVRARPYPYRGTVFSKLVSDSYRVCGSGRAADFYRWMEGAYARSRLRLWGRPGLTLERALEAAARDIASAKSRSARAALQLELATRLHRVVKATIPRFSLERGFEFANVVRYGERQCHLQSVLIASMLQRAGVDAGVVMVFRNERGEESNNGHAVTLVRLADGAHVLVDASEATPFAVHRGLFVRTAEGNRFVSPVFGGKSHRITAYRWPKGGKELHTSRVLPLSFDFVRSQFYYYRGERAPRGLLAAEPTDRGARVSKAFLLTSVRLCPSNPLAVYSLGRIEFAAGRFREAQALAARAREIYARGGWVPPGCDELLTKAEQILATSRARGA